MLKSVVAQELYTRLDTPSRLTLQKSADLGALTARLAAAVARENTETASRQEIAALVGQLEAEHAKLACGITDVHQAVRGLISELAAA